MDNMRDEPIYQALELAQELMTLADQGDAARQDVGCGVLYGTLRDCAYKIRALAQAELAEHKKTQKITTQAEGHSHSELD